MSGSCKFTVSNDTFEELKQPILDYLRQHDKTLANKVALWFSLQDENMQQALLNAWNNSLDMLSKETGENPEFLWSIINMHSAEGVCASSVLGFVMFMTHRFKSIGGDISELNTLIESFKLNHNEELTSNYYYTKEGNSSMQQTALRMLDRLKIMGIQGKTAADQYFARNKDRISKVNVTSLANQTIYDKDSPEQDAIFELGNFFDETSRVFFKAISNIQNLTDTKSKDAVKNQIISELQRKGFTQDVFTGKNLDAVIESLIATVEQLRKQYPGCVFYTDPITLRGQLSKTYTFEKSSDGSEVDIEDGSILTGVPDMFLITADGKISIIDFKTDSSKDGHKISHYEDQIYAYEQLVEASLGAEGRDAIDINKISFLPPMIIKARVNTNTEALNKRKEDTNKEFDNPLQLKKKEQKNHTLDSRKEIRDNARNYLNTFFADSNSFVSNPKTGGYEILTSADHKGARAAKKKGIVTLLDAPTGFFKDIGMEAARLDALTISDVEVSASPIYNSPFFTGKELNYIAKTLMTNTALISQAIIDKNFEHPLLQKHAERMWETLSRIYKETKYSKYISIAEKAEPANTAKRLVALLNVLNNDLRGRDCTKFADLYKLFPPQLIVNISARDFILAIGNDISNKRNLNKALLINQYITEFIKMGGTQFTRMTKVLLIPAFYNKIDGAINGETIEEYNNIDITEENTFDQDDNTEEESSITEEDSDTENYMLEKKQVSVKSTLTADIKTAISSLPIIQYMKNKEGIYMDQEIKDPYGYGLPVYMNPDEVLSQLLNICQGVKNSDDMLKVFKKWQLGKPWLKTLILKAQQDAKFKTNLFRSIKRTATVYTSIFFNNNTNRLEVKTVNLLNGGDKFMQEYKNMTIQDCINSGVLIPYKGQLVFAAQDLDRIKLLTQKLTYTINTENQNWEYATQLSVILSKFNIPLRPETILQIDIIKPEESYAKLYHLINDYFQSLADLANTKGISKDSTIMPTTPEGNQVYNKVKNIADFLDPFLEANIEASFYENGKTQYAYMNPNYITDTMDILRDVTGENNTDAKYQEALDKKYGTSWFKHPGGKYKNVILSELAENYSLRKQIRHTVTLNIKGNEYRDMTPLQRSQCNMMLFINGNNFLTKSNYDPNNTSLSYYSIPILGNKNSFEFISFKRYTEANITSKYYMMFNQELQRIHDVIERYRQRAKGARIEDFGIKEKMCYDIPDFSKTNKKLHNAIMNHTITINDFKKLTNGGSFLFMSPFIDSMLADTNTAKYILERINVTKDSVPSNIYSCGLFEKAFNKAKEDFIAQELQDMKATGLTRKDNNGYYVNMDFLYEIIEKVNKEYNITFETEQQYKEFCDSQINKFLREFVLNDYLMRAQMYQLFYTDLAFYPTAEEVQKRTPAGHAPGTSADTSATWKGKPVTDGYQRNMVISDINLKAEIHSNVKQALKSYRKHRSSLLGYTKDQDILLTGIENTILQSLEKVNIADAQAMNCYSSFRKKKIMFGQWSEELEKALNRIKLGVGTLEDMKLAMMPLKPVVFSHATKPDGLGGTMDVPIYNKNSEYLIVLAEALIQGANALGDKTPNILEGISNFMEMTHANGRLDGIDTIEFASAVNTGSSGIVDISKCTTSEEIFNALADAYTNRYEDCVHTVPFEDFRMQQENPMHFKDHEQLEGSQGRILNLTCVPDGTQITINGVTKRSEELRREAKELHAENIKQARDQLIKDLGLKGTRKDKNRILSKLLLEEIAKSDRYGEEIRRACQIDPKTGEFVMPIGEPIQARRIQELLNSIVKSRINKQYRKGGPVVQATCYGTDSVHSRFKNKEGKLLYTEEEFRNPAKKKGIMNTSEFADDSKYSSYAAYVEAEQHSFAYYEVLAPIPDSKMQKLLWDSKKHRYKTPAEALKEGLITEEQLKLLGRRIPTEDAYSMMPCKIVGWVPAGQEIVMYPRDITAITGSDFDNDKIYLYAKEYVGKNTELKLEKAAKDGYKNKYLKKARDNRIFDIEWTFLTSPECMVSMFNPGGFDTLKSITKAIVSVKEGGEVSAADFYEFLSSEDPARRASLKNQIDQQAINAKRNPLTFSSQNYFHKQNMIAAKLIGVFANSNVSHAFCMGKNISFNISNHLRFQLGALNCNKIETAGSKETPVTLAPLDPYMSLDGVNTVSRNIAMFLAASVDAVKDPLLSKLNFNTFTTSLGVTLLRMGLDLPTVATFLAQPICCEVSDKFFEENDADTYTSGKSIIRDMLQKINPYAANNSAVPTIDLQALVNGLDPKNRNKDMDTNLLLIMQKLCTLSQKLGELTFITKFNSMNNVVGPTIADTDVLRTAVDRFLHDRKNDPIFTENAYTIIQDTYNLSGKAEQADPLLQAFYAYTIGPEGIIHRLFTEFFQGSWSFESVKQRFLHDYCKGKPTKELIHKLENAYMYILLCTPITYHGKTTTFIDTNNVEAIKSMIIDMPYKVDDLRKKYKDEFATNTFLRSLFKQKGNSTCPYDTITILHTKRGKEEQEDITKDWTDLLKSEHEDLRNFALEFFRYNILRTGISFSPRTATHMAGLDLKLAIPEYMNAFHAAINNGMEDMEYPNDDFYGIATIDTGYVLDQFVRNNSSNRAIVPKFIPREDVKETKDEDGKSIISFGVAKDKYEVYKGVENIMIDWKLKITSPFIEYKGKLYKRQHGGSEILVTYKEVSRLGIENNFMEYYPLHKEFLLTNADSIEESIFDDLTPTNFTIHEREDSLEEKSTQENENNNKKEDGFDETYTDSYDDFLDAMEKKKQKIIDIVNDLSEGDIDAINNINNSFKGLKEVQSLLKGVNMNDLTLQEVVKDQMQGVADNVDLALQFLEQGKVFKGNKTKTNTLLNVTSNPFNINKEEIIKTINEIC